MMTREQVRYGNGVVEPALGIVPLEFTLQARQLSTVAYVFHGKGPMLILGFPFLEAQGLLVDCDGRQLFPKSSRRPMACLPSDLQPSLAIVKVKRFRIGGRLPPLPQQKYQSDVGADIFATRSSHIRPGQCALVDMGLACAFPRSHWCLLKYESSLAVHHGIIVLSRVVDGNYRGRIQVIILNMVSCLVTIPRFALMCQAILMPQTGSHFQDGLVNMTTD